MKHFPLLLSYFPLWSQTTSQVSDTALPGRGRHGVAPPAPWGRFPAAPVLPEHLSSPCGGWTAFSGEGVTHGVGCLKGKQNLIPQFPQDATAVTIFCKTKPAERCFTPQHHMKGRRVGPVILLHRQIPASPDRFMFLYLASIKLWSMYKAAFLFREQLS